MKNLEIELNKTQEEFDKLLMEIGLLKSKIEINNDEKLFAVLNEKITTFQLIELKLRQLEMTISKNGA
ncbi:MAG TPA: hypothetical protein PK431_15700 [Chitinophagales bacterium]|nr:hypothetical protein [Chitinophagales bacterium]